MELLKYDERDFIIRNLSEGQILLVKEITSLICKENKQSILNEGLIIYNIVKCVIRRDYTILNYCYTMYITVFNNLLKKCRYEKVNPKLKETLIDEIKKDQCLLSKILQKHKLNDFLILFMAEIIDNLIYFGVLIENLNFYNYRKKTLDKKLILILKEIELLEKIEKAFYGRKIAKYIKEQLDDEFEMKPLRTKIDLRKFIENNNKKKENE